jgi:hypothetical protein
MIFFRVKIPHNPIKIRRKPVKSAIVAKILLTTKYTKYTKYEEKNIRQDEQD